MQRILYVDLLSPMGHRYFNMLNIKALSKKFDVVTAGRENAIESTKPDIVIPEDFFMVRNKVDFRIKELRMIDWLLRKQLLEDFDLIIFSSYETISFSLRSKDLQKKCQRAAIINHNNIDELEKSAIKRKFFRKIDKGIFQCVFEEYFKVHLQNELNVENNVVVIPHIVLDRTHIAMENVKPLVFVPTKLYNTRYLENVFSESVDEVSFVIKSDVSFNKKNVKSISYLERSQYEDIFSECSFVLLPLTTDYNYRVSSILYECFSFSRPCFVFKNKFSSFLGSMYPNVVHIIDEETPFKTIWEIYTSINREAFEKDRENFLNKHSENRFLESIMEILNLK